MAGLVPAISLRDALCPPKRDARVKPAHDKLNPRRQVGELALAARPILFERRWHPRLASLASSRAEMSFAKQFRQARGQSAGTQTD
jgi:hypothetical protein